MLGYNPAATTGYYAGFHDFFGLPIDPRGNIIGVLIAAWACARIEGMVRRFMPDDLDMLLTSLITLLITATTEMEVKMAQLVTELVPTMDMVRMVNSGTEATMSAIRLARGFTGRDKIIKFEGCYHGHADCLLVKAGSDFPAYSERVGHLYCLHQPAV